MWAWACVCACVWKVTELLQADWRRSLAERQERLQASTPQPVQHKQATERLFWVVGVISCLDEGWGQIDPCVCCVGGCVLSASWRQTGGQASFCLQPDRKSESAHAPPLWVRYWTRVPRRRWTNAKKRQISTAGGAGLKFALLVPV